MVSEYFQQTVNNINSFQCLSLICFFVTNRENRDRGSRTCPIIGAQPSVLAHFKVLVPRRKHHHSPTSCVASRSDETGAVVLTEG